MTRLTAEEEAHILIADLSGYTAYLAASEPEHAPVIAGDFLSAVVARLRPLFHLEKLEGDGAFLYAPIDRLDGSHRRPRRDDRDRCHPRAPAAQERDSCPAGAVALRPPDRCRCRAARPRRAGAVVDPLALAPLYGALSLTPERHVSYGVIHPRLD
jgi:hypothetical protein